MLIKVYYRMYQTVLRIASYFINWHEPKILKGEKSFLRLAKGMKAKKIKHILIITDERIEALGLIHQLKRELIAKEIQVHMYNKTTSNPTIGNIEEALKIYKREKCEAIIGFGGGSPLDCAKGVGARVANPNKTISSMKGLLKVRKKLPLLVAIPTTAGTGSEATLAAVVTNQVTHEKYALNDPVLIPSIAVLNPSLTLKLPAAITAGTGMDALTHAVESYIGKANTRKTRDMSKKAVKLIAKNLKRAYENGNDIEARENMQMASYYAGVAFTRAYVGYAHAIAHTLGGFYAVPHGLANAIILPYVLEAYGKSIEKPLAELYDIAGLEYNAKSREEKAKAFIQYIKDMNKSMNIPEKVVEIKKCDIPEMVKRADKEANPTYPVPRIMTKKELYNIYISIMVNV